MATPSILFSLRSHKYYAPDFDVNDTNYTDAQKEKIRERMRMSNFVRTGIIGYINRKNATERTPSEEEKEIQNMIENNTMNGSMLNYMDNRGGSTGSFDKDGDCSVENLKKKQEELSQTKSCVWTAVISFIPEYSQMYVDNKEQAARTIRDTINKFFKDAGLEPDNMEWVGAYHVNTDNRHIHLAFWEKEAKMIDTKGNPKFSEPMIKKDVLNKYKYTIANYHNAKDTDSLKLRDDITAPLKSFLKNEEAIDFLSSLNKELGIMTNWQYSRQSIRKQHLIDVAVDKFLETDKGVIDKNGEYKRQPVKKIKSEFEKELSVIQRHILSNYAEVKMEPTENALKFEDNNLIDLKKRLGNAVLKAVKELRQIDEITDSRFTQSKLESLRENLSNQKNPEEIDEESAFYKICEKGYVPNEEQDSFNPLEFKQGFMQDKEILNKYGIDYVCERYIHSPTKDEDGKNIKNDDGSFVFQDQDAIKQHIPLGDYNKYTFVNKNGTKATYFLNLHNTKQNSFNTVLKQLGFNDKTILNFCCDLSKKGLTFNLMTKTDNSIEKAINKSRWNTMKLHQHNERISQIRSKLEAYNKGNSTRTIKSGAVVYRAQNKKMGLILKDLLITLVQGFIYMDQELPRKKRELEEELEKELLERENQKGLGDE